jgi:hypothetical protein
MSGPEEKDQKPRKSKRPGESDEAKRKRREYDAARYMRLKSEVNARSRKWAKENPERTRQISKRSRDRRRISTLLRYAKRRAEQTGKAFSITREDLHLPEVCPIFNTPLVYEGHEENHDFSPSIDRIDSSKGYVPGNVQVLSRLANCMKWTATPEQLVTFARAVLRIHDAG